MEIEARNHLIGSSPLHNETPSVSGEIVQLQGETFYRIAHYDQMPPFFISLVSSSDHWLFISSSGGMTAGRINVDSALFPYETEDKLTAHSEFSGGKTIVHVTRGGKNYLWEPFSERYAGVYRCDRHLYKNIYGNKLIFEEINHDLQLAIRSAWRTSDRFGFVRSCRLQNFGDDVCRIDLLDGLQNLLPYGATEAMQSAYSNLLHAYKRNELERETGLGIFALSATLTDRAEPSESLEATVAWQVGLKDAAYLISTDQLDAFRNGRDLIAEYDLRGKPGAYFANAAFDLLAGQSQNWHIVADVNQDSAAVVRLQNFLRQKEDVVEAQIEEDIGRGTTRLAGMVAAADGLQMAGEETTTAHHYANVLFNIMRGGVFADSYQVKRSDLLDFMQVRNRVVLDRHEEWFASLPAQLSIQELYECAAGSGAPDLVRLCYEYLPLTFSRRHGDPSRPWNKFSINLKNPDGSPRLDYQGNWRDIFQNWEALLVAFPGYVEGMIAKFLNATTADGYNPYRITRDGIEWEIPEPDNPWSNIGYWSDHQIIYLQKLLEIAEQVQPGLLSTWWNRPIFTYADVPYRLRPSHEMLADWYNTIEFDWEREKAKELAVDTLGTDGRLLQDVNGAVIHVTLGEKLLTLLLAKLTNLVPGGGIWMNTQRPEWNDANNALVGKGLSVVTTAYLRRFIAFWLDQLGAIEEASFLVNSAVATLLADVKTVLSMNASQLESGFSDQTRCTMLEELGKAATTYRTAVYQEDLSAMETRVPVQMVQDFLVLAQDYIEQTLRSNRRPDGLYHAYNIMRLEPSEAAVENLYPMLEGQVAILSSGLLSPEEALSVLQAMRHSDLYRPDQHSYMLYPNRYLPGFLKKNNVSATQTAGSKLVAALTEAGDRSLLIRDDNDVYHFPGSFRNASDVERVLDDLALDEAYSTLVTAERAFILDLFETTFNHRAFTGRSGTFFAYEGLGSIYWHMVAKLLLAAQESFQQAVDAGAGTEIGDALAAAYYDIRQGLGFNKSPAEYGAFPTDPYSHTPFGCGARQPGMTGQVKEEVLTRMGELGVIVRGGVLHFVPALLRREEFLSAPAKFSYWDVGGVLQHLPLRADSLAFTFCQTPVVYVLGDVASIEVIFKDNHSLTVPGSSLDAAATRQILARDGRVKVVIVTISI